MPSQVDSELRRFEAHEPALFGAKLSPASSSVVREHLETFRADARLRGGGDGLPRSWNGSCASFSPAG